MSVPTRELPGLSTRVLGRDWRHFDSLPTTNDYLKDNADRLPHGAAVTAGRQTAGKGRLGRRWESAAGCGLALSALLHGWPPADMALLPLLAGLAVSEAVDDLCGVRSGVKWSNDVLLGDRKLCGILCESRLSSAAGFAVVGIGVNLLHTQADFTRLGLVYATSLFLATDKLYGPDAVAAAILNHLEPVLDQFRTDGFEPLRTRYRERCVTLGRPVRVTLDGAAYTGDALDIAADGALLCRLDGLGERPVHAGETSVRGIYGYV